MRVARQSLHMESAWESNGHKHKYGPTFVHPEIRRQQPFPGALMPTVPPSCVGHHFSELPVDGGAMTGPVRTSVARKHVQPPRPPNAWILYRSEKIRTLPPLQPGEARRAQADVSRMISEMWKNETEEERSRYERMAEQKKAEHHLKYPGYRFQPQKKEEKQRLRELMKQERQSDREARKNRGRVPAVSAPTPTFPTLASQLTALLYTPETQYGPAGPSPPLSAAPSPRIENVSSPESDDLSIATPNASQPPISAQQNPPISLPLISANTPFSIPPDICWAAQPSATHSLPILSTAWDHQATTDLLPILLTPEDSTNEFISFDVQSLSTATSQEWICNDRSQELEESLQAFLSTTIDASIFHLNNTDINLLTANPIGDIEASMGQIPLGFENVLAPENSLSIPDYTSIDFSNMAGPSSQPLDMISPLNMPSLGLRMSSGSSDSATYNGEEFLNFDETFTSETAPEPQSCSAWASSPCSSSYVTPSEAAYSSTQRAGTTWKGARRVPAK